MWGEGTEEYGILMAAPKIGAESNSAFGVKSIQHRLQPSLVAELFHPLTIDADRRDLGFSVMDQALLHHFV